VSHSFGRQLNMAFSSSDPFSCTDCDADNSHLTLQE
jgi:hypothetical protein